MIHSSARPDAPLDDATVLQASGREPERFAEIFHRYFAEIHRYVARRLGADTADDIAAETFLAAFRKREKFDPAQGAVRPWLYGMATNLVGSHRRAEMRYFAALARTPVTGAVEDHGELVADQMMASSHRSALAAALADLQATDRDVLLLIAFADFSYRDVAGALSDPHALIGYLAALAGSGQGDEGAFLMIEGTFVDDAPPPAVAVKLYRALGDIPGVTVDNHAVDVAGRHGVAFARGGEEIILSNGSYRFMGFVTDGAAGHPVLDGEAILQRVPVSGAFVLP